ncbi:RHS repeat-associated core domain-containing protein [Pseudoalteromonas obscura]|uniref:RHS repeat-associated core domain-containing protein n=1 Tax=Pseudoalteromonas obscura TaxID=3048491 RepID=A0ABT7EIY7_9GAMM|nr:RHS repeat-associated core domain-containing protein [Pseudoalteromonas sp. P94(2023)]MDK2594977.1 RHS repeat-associated core domain-containing protein [Pseudoalteromonas sp. P94(2023)]
MSKFNTLCFYLLMCIGFTAQASNADKQQYCITTKEVISLELDETTKKHTIELANPSMASIFAKVTMRSGDKTTPITGAGGHTYQVTREFGVGRYEFNSEHSWQINQEEDVVYCARTLIVKPYSKPTISVRETRDNNDKRNVTLTVSATDAVSPLKSFYVCESNRSGDCNRGGYSNHFDPNDSLNQTIPLTVDYENPRYFTFVAINVFDREEVKTIAVARADEPNTTTQITLTIYDSNGGELANDTVVKAETEVHAVININDSDIQSSNWPNSASINNQAAGGGDLSGLPNEFPCFNGAKKRTTSCYKTFSVTQDTTFTAISGDGTSNAIRIKVPSLPNITDTSLSSSVVTAGERVTLRFKAMDAGSGVNNKDKINICIVPGKQSDISSCGNNTQISLGGVSAEEGEYSVDFTAPAAETSTTYYTVVIRVQDNDVDQWVSSTLYLSVYKPVGIALIIPKRDEGRIYKRNVTHTLTVRIGALHSSHPGKQIQAIEMFKKSNVETVVASVTNPGKIPSVNEYAGFTLSWKPGNELIDEQTFLVRAKIVVNNQETEYTSHDDGYPFLLEPGTPPTPTLSITPSADAPGHFTVTVPPVNFANSYKVFELRSGETSTDLLDQEKWKQVATITGDGTSHTREIQKGPDTYNQTFTYCAIAYNGEKTRSSADYNSIKNQCATYTNNNGGGLPLRPKFTNIDEAPSGPYTLSWTSEDQNSDYVRFKLEKEIAVDVWQTLLSNSQDTSFQIQNPAITHNVTYMISSCNVNIADESKQCIKGGRLTLQHAPPVISFAKMCASAGCLEVQGTGFHQQGQISIQENLTAIPHQIDASEVSLTTAANGVQTLRFPLPKGADSAYYQGGISVGVKNQLINSPMAEYSTGENIGEVIDPLNHTPTLGQSGQIYVGMGNQLCAFDGQNRQWCNATGGFLSSRAVATTAGIGTDVIFAGSRDHSIYAWSQNGTQLWKNTTQGAIEAEGLLVGKTQNDATLFYGSDDGALYALNALDGNTKYVYKLGARTIQKPMLVGDNEIWVTTAGDQLHVIKRGSAGVDKLLWGDLQDSPLLDGFNKDIPAGWVPTNADHEATYPLLRLGYVILQRELSRFELSFLTYAVRYNNVTLLEVAEAMLQSPEGKWNHPDSLINLYFYDSISNMLFFTVRAEIAGKSRAQWVSELDAGLSRAELILQLVRSIEVAERYEPVVISSLFYYYGICHSPNQCKLTTDSDGDGVSDAIERVMGTRVYDPRDGLLESPTLTLSQVEAGMLSASMTYHKNIDYFEFHNPADNTGPTVLAARNKTATTSSVYPNGSHTFYAKACIEREITFEGDTRIHRACSNPSGTQVIEISNSTIQGQIHPLSVPNRAANYHGPNVDQLAEHHSLATTTGHFRVNEQGAATYSIPLPLPAGIAGVTPEVALTYNSQSGPSSVAFGWQLSTGSSITRCRQTKLHDGQFEAIRPWRVGNDRYCLDGSRLILTNDVTEGEVGAEYRSEVDSQIRVVVEAPALSGTKQFAVYGKDGSKRIYGGSPDSELGGTSSHGWLLRQSMDRIAARGDGTAPNIVHYHYSKGGESQQVLGNLETVLSKIEYSGNEDGTEKYSVKFGYKKGAARQVAFDYSAVNKTMVSQAELTYISINKGSETLRHIDLGFESAANGARLLKSVRECASDRLEVCKKPVTFDYTQSFAQPQLLAPTTLVSAPANKKVVGTSFVDLLGNGKATLVSLAQTNNARQHQLCVIESQSVQNCTLIDTNSTADNIEMYAFDKEDNGRQGLVIRTANRRSDAHNKWEYFSYDGSRWHNSTMINTLTMHNLRLGDLNGDGFADLLYTGGQNYNTYRQLWSQTDKDVSPIQETVSLDYIDDDKPFYLMDVNFDGLADVVTSDCAYSGCRTPGKRDVVLVHFNQYDTRADKHKFGDSRSLQLVHSRLMPMDVNADGIVDYGYVNADEQWAFSLVKPYSGTFYSQGTEITLPSPTSANIKPEDTHIAPIQADLDKDGIPELYVVGKDNLTRHYYLYRYEWDPADSTFKIPNHEPVYELGEQLSVTDSIFFLDYDHDGVEELILSIGNQLKVKEALYRAGPPNILKRVTQGYGNQTEINYGLASDPTLYTLGEHSKTEALGLQSNARVDDLYGGAFLVERVTTGSLQTIDDVTSNIDLAVDYHYEGARIQFGGRGSLGFEALTTTTQKDGITFKTRTEYSQAFPLIGMPTRTLKTMTVDNTNVVISDAKNDYQYHVNGCDKTTDTCADNNDKKPGYFTVYAHRSRECAARMDVKYAGAIQYGVSGYNCSITTTQQDPFANVTSITVDQYDAANASDFISHTSGQLLSSVTTNNTYYTSDDWLELGRLHQVDVTTTRTDGSAQLEKRSEFTYHAGGPLDGMLISEVINPQGNCNEYLKTSYSYDAVGNVVSKETSGKTQGCSGNTTRKTQTRYDADGRYVKSKVIVDPSSQADSHSTADITTLNVISRNKFGQVTESSNSDGVRQYTKYDDFGEAIGSHSATGAQQYTVRTACPFEVDNCAVAINSYQNHELLGQTFLDKLGREIGSKVQTPGSQWLYSKQHYDAWGRVVKQLPAGLQSTETVYDVFDNPVKVTDNQTGLVTTLTKAGRTATSTVTGNVPGDSQTQTTTFNVYGEKATETDNAGNVLTYTYNVLGKVVKVKSSADNNKVLIENSYNLLTGLKVSQTDLDSGTWTYDYNAFGDLIKQTDANGNVQTFGYDVFGRKVSHDVNGARVATWVYDTEKKHRLAYEYTSDWSKGYIYDGFGRNVASVTDFDSTALECKSTDHVWYEPSSKDVRISTDLASVDSSQCVVQLTTFDEFGRVFQQFDDYRRLAHRNEYIEAQGVHLTYRAGQVVTKKEAREGTNGTLYYQFSKADSAGRVTHYSKGRFAMSVGYGDMGFLSDLAVQGSYGYIQSHSYQFDGLGNLTSRAFSLDGGQIEISQFGYDDLNRVTTVNGETEFAYTANGNLTTKSGWTQHYEDTRPHAISSRVKGSQVEAFKYDQNGNQISAKRTNGGSTDYQRDVVYSARNKATHITVNGELVQFSYDTNNRRFKRVERNKTIFYVGALEIVKESGSEALSAQTYIRRNIGNDAVKTYHENGQESIQWLFTDHQGSVVAVVNHSGKLLKRFSYDVFGKQSEVLMPNNDIDKLNWALETGLFWTVASNQRAYTGHEPVKFGDDTRIIHMNGRIYDADTGRFMQTDPFVQAPSNLQNYNRYSYVLNNPLSYTDPSGYLFKKLTKFIKKNWRTIVAVVAAYVTFGASTGAWTFGEVATLSAGQLAAGGIAAGAVSGAISTGSIEGALTGAVSGGLFGAIGAAGLGGVNTVAASSLAGGIMSVMQGGKFGHGFVSAGVGAATGRMFGKAPINRIVGSAIVGGTVSAITGGKFANGAMTAAFATALRADWESGQGFEWDGVYEVGSPEWDAREAAMADLEQEQAQTEINGMLDNGGKGLLASNWNWIDNNLGRCIYECVINYPGIELATAGIVAPSLNLKKPSELKALGRGGKSVFTSIDRRMGKYGNMESGAVVKRGKIGRIKYVGRNATTLIGVGAFGVGYTSGAVLRCSVECSIE